jgi:hypothetical protein
VSYVSVLIIGVRRFGESCKNKDTAKMWRETLQRYTRHSIPIDIFGVRTEIFFFELHLVDILNVNEAKSIINRFTLTRSTFENDAHEDPAGSLASGKHRAWIRSFNSLGGCVPP